MSINALLQQETEDQEWSNIYCNSVSTKELVVDNIIGVPSGFVLNWSGDFKIGTYAFANGIANLTTALNLGASALSTIVIPIDGQLARLSYVKSNIGQSHIQIVKNGIIVDRIDTTIQSGVYTFGNALPLALGDILAIRCDNDVGDLDMLISNFCLYIQ